MATTHSGDGDAAHRFQELCSGLKMDPGLTQRAWTVVEQVSPQVEMKQGDERFWFACGILTSMLSARLENEAAATSLPTLSDVLQRANVRLVDVFEPMQNFVELAKPKQVELIKKEMDLLARRFIVMSLFTKKYKDMFSSLLDFPQRNNASSVYSFGWLLFLSANTDILSNKTNVVNLLNVLLCCVSFLSVLSTPEKRKKPLTSGDEDGECLALLANLYSTNVDELTKMYKEAFLPYIQKLCETGVLRFQTEDRTASLVEPIATKQLQGVMEEEIMERNVVQLRKQYMKRMHGSFTMNELALLETPEDIGTPSKMPPKMKQYYNYKGAGGPTSPQSRVGEKSPLSPRSPVTPRTIRVTIPATPVTSTMQTLGWLERVVAQQEDGPSTVLKGYFEACQGNPAESITSRVASVTAQVAFAGEQGLGRSEVRRKQAAKLYYRLLEAMLVAEEQRLQTKDFAALLAQDLFHKSLIACCMEITAYCYKLDHLRYPHIPEQLAIEPFEYCKIIENVLRHEVSVPLVLRRHLMRIEEQILEEDAWKEGSSLFTLLARPGQQEHIYQQFHVSGSQTASGSETPGKQFASQPTSLTPSRLRRRAAAPLHSPAPSKVAVNSTPGSTPRSRSLELFFRKVLSLANVRMQQLFKRMEIPAGIYHHLWFSFVHELIWFPAIVKNRHLDQIIMCTLYGVCRANKLEAVTFRKMLDGYRHQPQASSTLWRSVLLENGERGDIIKFYNQVFITMLEDVLWKYQGRVPQTPSFAPASSPMKVAPKYNLYLSPLKGSKFVAAGSTSGGGIRYSIGQSPAQGLEDINKNMVKVGTKRKASRKLDFGSLASDNKKQRTTEEDGAVVEATAGSAPSKSKRRRPPPTLSSKAV